LNKKLAEKHQSELIKCYEHLYISLNMKTETSVMKKTVHASFKKVISFDLLFLGLGIPIGAGILAAILYL